jgi:hypothetical protein
MRQAKFNCREQADALIEISAATLVNASAFVIT